MESRLPNSFQTVQIWKCVFWTAIFYMPYCSSQPSSHFTTSTTFFLFGGRLLRFDINIFSYASWFYLTLSWLLLLRIYYVSDRLSLHLQSYVSITEIQNVCFNYITSVCFIGRYLKTNGKFLAFISTLILQMFRKWLDNWIYLLRL
jgi:hypothetical protein